MGSLGTLMILLAVHSLSIRIEIGKSEIVYRSAFGHKVLQLRDVESALPSSMKGTTFLTIRAGRKFISCSTYTFSLAQLKDIRDTVEANCKAVSKTVTTYAPITERSMVTLLAVYSFIVCAVLSGIIILGIHHLHTRAPPQSQFRDFMRDYRVF
jgi:CII-binding regulator of phage lambda lysogenization HflD